MVAYAILVFLNVTAVFSQPATAFHVCLDFTSLMARGIASHAQYTAQRVLALKTA